DYVRSVEASTEHMPRKVVITNGEWIAIFTDPRDAFSTSGTASASKILAFEKTSTVEINYHLIFEQLEYSCVRGERRPVSVSEVGFHVAPNSISFLLRGLQVLYD